MALQLLILFVQWPVVGLFKPSLISLFLWGEGSPCSHRRFSWSLFPLHFSQCSARICRGQYLALRDWVWRTNAQHVTEKGLLAVHSHQGNMGVETASHLMGRVWLCITEPRVCFLEWKTKLVEMNNNKNNKTPKVPLSLLLSTVWY